MTTNTNTNGTNTPNPDTEAAAVAAWNTLTEYWISEGIDPVLVRRFIPHPGGSRRSPPGLERVTVTLLGTLQGSKKTAAVPGSAVLCALQAERDAVKTDQSAVMSIQGVRALAKAKTGGK